MTDRPTDRVVDDEFARDARSIGALHGSARGNRNIAGRLRAMRRLADLTGEALLDVGCGTGEYTMALAPGFDRVEAIDIEPERLELFGRTAPDGVTVSSMSVNELSFDDEAFDVVTMIEVLEHLSDPSGALREIRRVLRPDGKLLVTTPSRYWPLEQHGVLLGSRRAKSVYFPGIVWLKPLHIRLSDAAAFTRKDLGRMADAGGLRLRAVTYMMPPLDSLGSGHWVHRRLDRLERGPLAPLGQTIVACLERP